MIKFVIMKDRGFRGRLDLSYGQDEYSKSLPNDKILDWSTFKAFADDKINVTEKGKFVLENIFSFPQNFFKRLLIQGP